MAVFGFKLYNAHTPKTVNIEAIKKAKLTLIRPDGIGRFLVRCINASRSLSIIWLKALEAPTIKYPPKASNINGLIWIASAAKKYPAIDEKTTLTDNLIFVIDLKSDTAIATEENEDLDCNWILFTSILSAQRYFIITIYQCKNDE